MQIAKQVLHIRDAVSTALGSQAEQCFLRCIAAHGYAPPKPATRFQDMREHWDFKVQGLGRVEVKSMKCAQRGGTPDASLWYLESKCVGGGPGWVKGKADWIAFQQEMAPKSSFVLCSRTALTAWLQDKESKLGGGSAAMGERSGIKGTFWSRPGRDDLVFCADRGEVLRALGPAEIKWIAE